MHLVLEHITKGTEDPVGIEVFRESTGREKQKGTGNDSPDNREQGLKSEKKKKKLSPMKRSFLPFQYPSTCAQ